MLILRATALECQQYKEAFRKKYCYRAQGRFIQMRSSFREAIEIAADWLGATDRRRRPDPGSWLPAGPHHGELSLSRTSTSAARKISDPASACL
jgi:hypothetical protein